EQERRRNARAICIQHVNIPLITVVQRPDARTPPVSSSSRLPRAGATHYGVGEVFIILYRPFECNQSRGDMAGLQKSIHLSAWQLRRIDNPGAVHPQCWTRFGNSYNERAEGRQAVPDRLSRI